MYKQSNGIYLVSIVLVFCLMALAVSEWTEANAVEQRIQKQATKSELAGLRELGKRIKGFVVRLRQNVSKQFSSQIRTRTWSCQLCKCRLLHL